MVKFNNKAMFSTETQNDNVFSLAIKETYISGNEFLDTLLQRAAKHRESLPHDGISRPVEDIYRGANTTPN